MQGFLCCWRAKDTRMEMYSVQCDDVDHTLNANFGNLLALLCTFCSEIVKYIIPRVEDVEFLYVCYISIYNSLPNCNMLFIFPKTALVFSYIFDSRSMLRQTLNGGGYVVHETFYLISNVPTTECGCLCVCCYAVPRSSPCAFTLGAAFIHLYPPLPLPFLRFHPAGTFPGASCNGLDFHSQKQGVKEDKTGRKTQNEAICISVLLSSH